MWDFYAPFQLEEEEEGDLREMQIPEAGAAFSRKGRGEI